MPRTRNNTSKYSFNDWGKPLEDLERTRSEIWETLLQKYGVDQDGDCPANFQLFDRTKFQAMHYQPVPYSYEAKTQKDFQDIYQVLSLNLSTALQDMDNFVRNMHDRLGMITFIAQNKDKIDS
jgi:hypothetical protein